MIWTTITRQKCRPPTSILGLRGDEKQVIDLEWPYVRELLIILLFSFQFNISILMTTSHIALMIAPPSFPTFQQTPNPTLREGAQITLDLCPARIIGGAEHETWIAHPSLDPIDNSGMNVFLVSASDIIN